nr:hypothetical protein [uncultured Sphaerochaeta sp.]
MMPNNVEIPIEVFCSGKPEAFDNFYGAFGYGNTDFTYTAPYKRQYQYLSAYHNHGKYMRIHNILTSHGQGDKFFIEDGQNYGNPQHDGQPTPPEHYYYDKVVSRDESGALRYNWETVDQAYDVIVGSNMKLIVEACYIPSALRSHPSAPSYDLADYNEWHDFIFEFVTHLISRYGLEEVRTWYFEVWNEPDNVKEWVEKPAYFLALYDYFVAAVKGVDEKLKVGGPAVKQHFGSFGAGAITIFKAFMDHCSKGINYKNGMKGSPLDFISIHCKGGRPGFSRNPSTQTMFDSIKEYAEILEDYPEFKSLEFFNDESDVVWSGNLGVDNESWLNFRNTHYFPGFVCKMVNQYITIVRKELGLNLTIVDSDNCHLHWEKRLFSGNRSQFTPFFTYPSTDLLRKSIFNAYILLGKLGNEMIPVASATDEFGNKFGALATRSSSGVFSVMVWNFEDGIEDDINERTINLNFSDLNVPVSSKLVHYRIDKHHSNAHQVWAEMGKPKRPTLSQIEGLRSREHLEMLEPVKDIAKTTDLFLALDMPMHSISLVMIVPANGEVLDTPSMLEGSREIGGNGNEQVFLSWSPIKSDRFSYYEVYRREVGTEKYTKISTDYSVDISVYVDSTVQHQVSYEYVVTAVDYFGHTSNKSSSVVID